MKRTAWTLGLSLFIAVLAVVWFFDTYEQVDTQVWTGPSAAARANPYLAAQRFSARMGFPTQTIERATELDSVAPGVTLVLPARRALVTPERAQVLLRWAAAGGHLVIEPEQAGRQDLLLDALQVGRAPTSRGKPVATLRVEITESEHPLQVTASMRDALDVARVSADWVVADTGGVRIASMRHGSGRVSLITGFQRFSNRALGAHDNAELLWRILRLAPSNAKVLWLRPPQAAPILQWLNQYAQEVMIASLVLLVLWLWRVGPRFGPMASGAEPARRQLLEHIRACARFRWASGARVALLDAARETCNARIRKLRPRLGVLAPERRQQELATELGISTEALAYAFDGKPNSAREFVHCVATLASIHGTLNRLPAAALLRRKRL